MKWTAEDQVQFAELERKRKEFMDRYMPALNRIVVTHRMFEAPASALALKLSQNATEIRAALKPFDVTEN
jgi:hypothetical protein